ncbi:MAG: PRC-barrel domain-containing protein, partial [Spirochaetota bacterium]
TNNQSIGRVDDLIISREGVVLYAEVSFGGFLGLGEQRYAIPVSVLEVDPYRRAVILDIPRDELEEIPPLPPEALPTTSGDWDEAIRRFWRDRLADVAGESARTAFAETLAERQDAGALRAGWLTDYPVTVSDGSVGSISNLLIDVEAPAVSYIVVELPSSATDEARWIPIPTDRMTFDPEVREARLDADEAELRDAPAYPFTERPGVTLDRSWVNEVDEYWGSSARGD